MSGGEPPTRDHNLPTNKEAECLFGKKASLIAASTGGPRAGLVSLSRSATQIMSLAVRSGKARGRPLIGQNSQSWLLIGWAGPGVVPGTAWSLTRPSQGCLRSRWPAQVTHPQLSLPSSLAPVKSSEIIFCVGMVMVDKYLASSKERDFWFPQIFS